MPSTNLYGIISGYNFQSEVQVQLSIQHINVTMSMSTPKLSSQIQGDAVKDQHGKGTFMAFGLQVMLRRDHHIASNLCTKWLSRRTITKQGDIT